MGTNSLAFRTSAQVLSLFLLIALGPGCPAFADTQSSANPGPPDREYLYQAKVGQRVEVFDVKKRFVYFEGAEYMIRGQHSGEFRGNIIVCSDARYFCIRGGIYAAIPKELSNQTQWVTNGIHCHSDDGLSKSAANSITCVFKRETTRFLYVEANGILSYGSSTRNIDEFKLVGRCGLFGSCCAKDSD